MDDEKDQGIRLFGKKIVLTENENVPAVSGQGSGGFISGDSIVNNFVAEDTSDSKKDHVKEETDNALQDKGSLPTRDEMKALSEPNETPKTPSINEEDGTLKPSNAENEQSDTTNSQQKTLKKPDKNVPCPRCNSMDTKFCYYNNYNVSQPRHFCKGCQRYWTAGGTMRNMPVGAGRRKNKNSISRSQHMSVPGALQATQIDASSENEDVSVKNNATILSFGADSQLCGPMTSHLSIAEQKVPTGVQKGLYKQGIPVPRSKGGEYGDDLCSGSSIKTSNSVLEARKDGIHVLEAQNIHGFSPQVPFHPAFPWPYPWNSAVPMHGMSPCGFSFPYFPTPCWNYNVPGYWNLPWMYPCYVTNQDVPICVSDSSALGKHSREGDLLRPINVEEGEDSKQNNSKQSILIPKTLRINDLDEAAKGSIFSSLGIKNDSVSKAFQPKKDDKSQTIRPSPVLQANPAALSRSLRFHEMS